MPKGYHRIEFLQWKEQTRIQKRKSIEYGDRNVYRVPIIIVDFDAKGWA